MAVNFSSLDGDKSFKRIMAEILEIRFDLVLFWC